MRYFAELAYNGTRFVGWQAQPTGVSVQATVEAALETVLRSPTSVVGCGRTDAGVHAEHFVLHFDSAAALPHDLLKRLNHLCGRDIVFTKIYAVADDAHARFDATSRSYVYKIDLQRSPFHTETAWFYPFASRVDTKKMQAAADLLLNYTDFATFCKTHTQVHTTLCTLTRSEWILTETAWEYHITANRFLRGMIRLIVGACLEIGQGRMSLEDLQAAMENKKALQKPLSVPPEGLYLRQIIY